MTMDANQILTPDVYQNYQEKNISPPQKASGNLTIKQFFVMLYEILKVENPDVVIAPSYPKYLLPGTKEYKATMNDPVEKFRDTITYKVTREEPASRGGSKQPFGGNREVTPQPREFRVGEDRKSHEVYGQMFDTLVQFDVWSISNYRVEDLAIWFKRFMIKYRGFLREMGLSEILFWWRGEDDVTSKIKNSINFRSLVYYIRTEEIMTSEEEVLKEIKYKIEEEFLE